MGEESTALASLMVSPLHLSRFSHARIDGMESGGSIAHISINRLFVEFRVLHHDLELLLKADLAIHIF